MQSLTALIQYFRLPQAAKLEAKRDRNYSRGADPGIDNSIDAAMDWIARAQDMSRSRDGGIARHYSLLSGWGTSYPETSGYIVPTLIDYALSSGRVEFLDRARRVLDWLASIQLADGGFQGGTVDLSPVVPVSFNTGQILLGLAKGARQFGSDYVKPMIRAADWLVATQDPDGCWRRNHSPFAGPGDKTYDTHIAWGLLEAARVCPDRDYHVSALRNIAWATTHQLDNGWIDLCCLNNPKHPLTHTLGYALRGMVEGYNYSKDKRLLEASLSTALALVRVLRNDGFLPGRFDRHWRPVVEWSCLTGTVQIAHSWLLLYLETQDVRLRDAAFLANQFVRTTVSLEGSRDTMGAVKGSFPVSGDYGQYEYLNWAAKFFVDSNLLEQRIRNRDPAQS